MPNGACTRLRVLVRLRCERLRVDEAGVEISSPPRSPSCPLPNGHPRRPRRRPTSSASRKAPRSKSISNLSAPGHVGQGEWVMVVVVCVCVCACA